MSKEQNTIATSLSKFSIVRAISALLKLGDDGKIESFLIKVIKKLNKEIVVHKKNLDILKFNYEQEIETLEEKLEDANFAYDLALLEIDPSKVSTNEQQARYIDNYLDNLDNKILVIQSLEKHIEAAKENYLKKVEEIEKQILSLNKRLNAVSKEK